ncbi:hypothetical protein D3C87_1274270 [compost metagenome]
MPVRSVSSRAPSPVRSTSKCMNDSSRQVVLPAGSASFRPPRPTRRIVPLASRQMLKTGWMVEWSVRPSRLISIVIESTRNGMSSLTISMIVWSECQPCSSSFGL